MLSKGISAIGQLSQLGQLGERASALSTAFHRDVVPGVHWSEDGLVNWYLIEEAGELTVIDAGLPLSWFSLQAALETLGRSPDDVKAIVLTHAHFDHVGFAEHARQAWGVPIYIHEREQSQSRHPRVYPNQRSVTNYLLRPSFLGVIGSFAARGMFLTRPLEAVYTFTDGDTLDLPGSPRMIATPGHTPGHTSVWLRDHDTLFTGDAVVGTDPFTQQPGPCLVARASTADVEQNLDSLARIAETSAHTLLSGHGKPMTDARAAVEQARLAPVG